MISHPIFDMAKDFKKSKHVLKDAVREFQATRSDKSAQIIVLSVILVAYAQVSRVRTILDTDDIVQIISMAVIRAAMKFDVESEFYPQTYLVTAAVHAVLDNPEVRKPRAVPVDTNSEALEKHLGYEPSFQDGVHGQIFVDTFNRTVLPWVRRNFPEKQVEIFKYRMGLTTGTPETLETVARRFGNSRQYINVIEKKITERIKKHLIISI